MPTMYETKRTDQEGRIKELEAELAKTKYNKRTQHHIGLIKAKIAELKEKAEQKKKGSGITSGYAIKKTGDATVALLGFPSVGKSTLLNSLTNANSKVGAYDFTTLDAIPGLVDYEGANIQVFDVPGIVSGAAEGSGRGKEVLAAIRAADLIMIVIDVKKPDHLDKILSEAYDTGLRLNELPPDVKINKTGSGGLDLTATCKLTHMNVETAKEMLRELGVVNAQVVIRDDVTHDQLIDAVKRNRVYLPSVTVINKADLDPSRAEFLRQELGADICISGLNKQHLDALKELLFTRLGLVRVYLKEIGKEPDKKEPMILRNGATVRDVCIKVHRSFVSKFKYAKVWGSSKFPGQTYGLDKKVKDKDVVELHLL